MKIQSLSVVVPTKRCINNCLRLSLNITEEFTKYSLDTLFGKCKSLGADQVTFRKLYTSGENTAQDGWIAKNIGDVAEYNKYFSSVNNYIFKNGRFLNILEYGQKQYSLNEMSIVVDDDCMAQEVKETMKYLILRPDCKLYSKWDDKGSLVF